VAFAWLIWELWLERELWLKKRSMTKKRIKWTWWRRVMKGLASLCRQSLKGLLILVDQKRNFLAWCLSITQNRFIRVWDSFLLFRNSCSSRLCISYLSDCDLSKSFNNLHKGLHKAFNGQVGNESFQAFNDFTLKKTSGRFFTNRMV